MFVFFNFSLFRRLTLIATLFLICSIFSQQRIIKIWSGLAPGSEAMPDKEKVVGGNIYGIYQPTLTIFIPSKIDPKKPALLVLPGGGYKDIVINKEGYKIANWLNENGIAAFVLKYRLDVREALQDAQRALSLIRNNAAEYNINSNNIGVIGFSAGGHLATNLGINYDIRNQKDHFDSVSCKPDFMVIVYGAVAPFINEVNKYTPPTFIVQANNDEKVSPLSAAGFYMALHKNNVPAELHIYAKGGHGFALRDIGKPILNWAKDCIEWFEVQGIVSK